MCFTHSVSCLACQDCFDDGAYQSIITQTSVTLASFVMDQVLLSVPTAHQGLVDLDVGLPPGLFEVSEPVCNTNTTWLYHNMLEMISEKYNQDKQQSDTYQATHEHILKELQSRQPR